MHWVKLSKFLSLILRHQPERFALQLDDQGWASLTEVMEILHGLPNFRWATRADVMAVVEGKMGMNSGSRPSKPRFEVEGERIRARRAQSVAPSAESELQDDAGYKSLWDAEPPNDPLEV